MNWNCKFSPDGSGAGQAGHATSELSQQCLHNLSMWGYTQSGWCVEHFTIYIRHEASAHDTPFIDRKPHWPGGPSTICEPSQYTVDPGEGDDASSIAWFTCKLTARSKTRISNRTRQAGYLLSASYRPTAYQIVLLISLVVHNTASSNYRSFLLAYSWRARAEPLHRVSRPKKTFLPQLDSRSRVGCKQLGLEIVIRIKSTPSHRPWRKHAIHNDDSTGEVARDQMFLGEDCRNSLRLCTAI